MNWSSEENVKIAYRLLTVRGYGPAQTNRLLFSLKPYVTNPRQLENSIENILKPQDLPAFEKVVELFQKDNKVGYISMLDEQLYPTSLRMLLHQNSPTILSYMGNLNLLAKRKVGFSGSRKASPKGLWITEDCVSQLAEKDVCVVSGYASGIDLAAHKTALEKNGSTFIVLPEGISYFYIKPDLKEVWDWNRVLVVSEFMPYDKWMASRAMKRNQTIIGLSNAMIVVEAGVTGGSMDAGLKTLLSAKTLFVPVFKEAPESAAGNEILIQRGARPLKLKRQTMRVNVDEVEKSVMDNTSDSLFN